MKIPQRTRVDCNMKKLGDPEAGFCPNIAQVKRKEPHKLLQVKFLGSQICEVPNLTNKQWLDLQARGQAKSEGALWEGLHQESKNVIRIEQRCDRTLLLSVYEQNAQMGQVCCWDFGELTDPQPKRVPNDHPTIQKAFKFLLPIAKCYANGTLKSPAELKQEGNSTINEHRVRKTPQGPKGLEIFKEDLRLGKIKVKTEPLQRQNAKDDLGALEGKNKVKKEPATAKKNNCKAGKLKDCLETPAKKRPAAANVESPAAKKAATEAVEKQVPTKHPASATKAELAEEKSVHISQEEEEE